MNTLIAFINQVKETNQAHNAFADFLKNQEESRKKEFTTYAQKTQALLSTFVAACLDLKFADRAQKTQAYEAFKTLEDGVQQGLLNSRLYDNTNRTYTALKVFVRIDEKSQSIQVAGDTLQLQAFKQAESAFIHTKPKDGFTSNTKRSLSASNLSNEAVEMPKATPKTKTANEKAADKMVRTARQMVEFAKLLKNPSLLDKQIELAREIEIYATHLLQQEMETQLSSLKAQ